MNVRKFCDSGFACHGVDRMIPGVYRVRLGNLARVSVKRITPLIGLNPADDRHERCDICSAMRGSPHFPGLNEYTHVRGYRDEISFERQIVLLRGRLKLCKRHGKFLRRIAGGLYLIRISSYMARTLYLLAADPVALPRFFVAHN